MPRSNVAQVVLGNKIDVEESKRMVSIFHSCVHQPPLTPRSGIYETRADILQLKRRYSIL